MKKYPLGQGKKEKLKAKLGRCEMLIGHSPTWLRAMTVLAMTSLVSSW